jgi:hypothetical protein
MREVNMTTRDVVVILAVVLLVVLILAIAGVI